MLNDVRATTATYLVRTMPANTRNQDDTSSIAETLHLLASRLGCEEGTVDVHAEDL